MPVRQISKTLTDSGFVSKISQHKCQMERFEIGFCCSAKQVGILLDVELEIVKRTKSYNLGPVFLPIL